MTNQTLCIHTHLQIAQANARPKMTKKYKAEIEEMKKAGLTGKEKMDWSFLYGEFSFGMQNDFEIKTIPIIT